MFSKLYKILFPDEAPERQKVLLVGSFVLVLFITIVAVFAPWKITVGVIATISALLLFFRFINFGFYLMVLVYPFMFLELFIGREINIPYVDLIAMFVFVAWVLRSIFLPPHGGLKFLKEWGKGSKMSLENFPGFLFFLFFLIICLISLVNSEYLAVSVKYIFRYVIFFYLMFVVLPYNVINSRKTLFRVFWILFGVGLFVSFMGLWSVVFSVVGGPIRRAVPVEIFGVSILGTNHNLIAEVLITVVPICFILIWETNRIWLKKFLIVSLLLMITINILTLSRTGWIALTFELFAIFLIKYRSNIKNYFKLSSIVAIIILPLFIYGYVFLTSNLVKDSTENRWQLLKISLDIFYDYPIVGGGIGTFVEQVSQNKLYIYEYGRPTEAHGLVQKILAETGILGFLSFFVFLGYILLKIIKIYRKIPNESPLKDVIFIMIVSSFGGCIFQFFQTSHFQSSFWLPIGIALAAVRLVEENFSNNFN